ncbi:MAG: hypothetical protein DHS20C18_10340 [Saprospiraceae bacterium]|nr:MAG: hypothetical protein DHS20C18_10340 [Saprospiraceae bacterium]
MTIPKLPFEDCYLIADELGIVYVDGNKDLRGIQLATLTKEDNDFGEFETMQINTAQFRNTNRGMLEVYEKMTNPSILSLSLPQDLQIISIDVFGPKIEDFEVFDEDFPEEKLSYSIDTDVLLKFNTNVSFFFTIHAKGSLLILNFYEKENTFKKYVQMTLDSWGEERGYRHKYTID